MCVIPARGGSKGLPGKNIKPLAGKPLIEYSIDAARGVVDDCDIFVSTDSEEIRSVCVAAGLEVPFLRPSALATDEAGTHEVIVHALEKAKESGRDYELLALLQPTSPFRTGRHIQEALALFDDQCDIVVSVKQPEDSPYYNQFRENVSGYLVPVVKRTGNRRQDSPSIYTYNGAIYVMRVRDLESTHMHDLQRIRKLVMDDKSSIQIDNSFDWAVAETIIQHHSDGI